MWETKTGMQIIAFLIALSLGGALSAVYSFLAAFFKEKKKEYAAIAIMQFAYFFIAAFVIFGFLMLYTNGILRGYIFIALILGFLIVRIALKKIIGKFVRAIIRILTVLKKYLKIALKPLARLKKFVYNLFVHIFLFFKGLAERFRLPWLVKHKDKKA